MNEFLDGKANRFHTLPSEQFYSKKQSQKFNPKIVIL